MNFRLISIITLSIAILYYTKNYLWTKRLTNKKKSFWDKMPVIRSGDNNQIIYKHLEIIDNNFGYKQPSNTTGYSLYSLDINKPVILNRVVQFLNDNYINGYIISNDYLIRKMEFTNSIGLILYCNETASIIGFIYSCSLNYLEKEMTYVDLMCVSKSSRSRGIAKYLIDSIIYYSPIKSIVHKKDNSQLPFQHFFKTSHYTASLAYLKSKYLKNTEDMDLDFKPLLTGIYRCSDSVKTYVSSADNRVYFSYAIFEFERYLHKFRIAELFRISHESGAHKLELETYMALISYLLKDRVDFLVIQPITQFLADKISEDYYSKSMDVYLYAVNIYINPDVINNKKPVFIEMP